MVDPVPVRELGKYGIIVDAAPFDLPPAAWSGGCNVVFQGGRVTSAPIVRDLSDIATVDYTNPCIHACVLDNATGYDPIILATSDYRMKLLQNNTITDVSPTGISGLLSTERYSSVLLGGLLYLNRADRVPLNFNPATGKFEALANWNAAHRCGTIRAYKDFLVSLNVQKGAIQHPAMVKWSDAVQSGLVPTNWDETGATLSSLSGENVLSEATSGIVDGMPLGNSFLIYTSTEMFSMDYVGTPLVMDFRRVFSDDGVIAKNCIVEVAGKHLIFGSRDIYISDGITKKSILEGRMKNYLYNSIDASKSNQCFAFHMPKLSSVFFAYPSMASDAAYKGGPYCNRFIIYNYLNDTLSVADAPNVTSATYANVASKETWGAATTSWAMQGGQWSDQDDDTLRHVVMTSVKIPSVIFKSRIVALDDVAASKVNKPAIAELLPESYVERRGLTLESLGIFLDSRATTSTMYPLVQSINPLQHLAIEFGRSDIPDAQPTTHTGVKFNPRTMYHVNSRNTGRYLAMKFTFQTQSALYLSGYDIEIKRVSRR